MISNTDGCTLPLDLVEAYNHKVELIVFICSYTIIK